MRALLIKPETFLESSVIPTAESILPPLGLLYIAATLKNANHTVQIFDMDLDSASLEDAINSFKPDWIGITSTTPQFPNAVRAAKKIKSLVDTPIVGGGTCNCCRSKIIR